MALSFDWNANKAAIDLRKHGVSLGEAATIYADPLSETLDDPDHSLAEHRFLTIGLSGRGRLLLVAHTDRGGVIRIISARRATRSEREYYEEKK